MNTRMDKLYIVIPAYNEAENIEGVVNEWYRELEREGMSEESRLLVIRRSMDRLISARYWIWRYGGIMSAYRRIRSYGN